jgi:hypothetical protein
MTRQDRLKRAAASFTPHGYWRDAPSRTCLLFRAVPIGFPVLRHEVADMPRRSGHTIGRFGLGESNSPIRRPRKRAPDSCRAAEGRMSKWKESFWTAVAFDGITDRLLQHPSRMAPKGCTRTAASGTSIWSFSGRELSRERDWLRSCRLLLARRGSYDVPCVAWLDRA